MISSPMFYTTYSVSKLLQMNADSFDNATN